MSDHARRRTRLLRLRGSPLGPLRRASRKTTRHSAGVEPATAALTRVAACSALKRHAMPRTRRPLDRLSFLCHEIAPRVPRLPLSPFGASALWAPACTEGYREGCRRAWAPRSALRADHTGLSASSAVCHRFCRPVLTQSSLISAPLREPGIGRRCVPSFPVFCRDPPPMEGPERRRVCRFKSPFFGPRRGQATEQTLGERKDRSPSVSKAKDAVSVLEHRKRSRRFPPEPSTRGKANRHSK